MEVDYEAVRTTGVMFIGAGYGWGDLSTREAFLVTKSVRKLTKILLLFSLKQ